MINASVGQSTSNSYVSVEQADAFFSTAVNSDDWLIDVNQKEAALIESTRILDLSFDWQGLIASSTQSLRWPRTDAFDADQRKLDIASIPKAIVGATCNLAYFLIQQGGLTQTSQGITGLKIGPIDIKYSNNQTVVGVPKFIVQSLQVYGTHKGFVSGSIASVQAIRC